MTRLPDTSETLLTRLADPADQAAWDQFIATYERALTGYCRSRGLQEADVREVLQEVLLAVHRQIPDWKPSGRRNSFRVWLLRTTHRHCLKAIRQRNRADCSVGGTEARIRIEAVCASDRRGDDDGDWRRWAFQWAASQVRDEVTPVAWNAFWRSAVQQVPAAEIAEQLEMSVGAVYTTKCRVLAKIRRRVEQLSRSES